MVASSRPTDDRQRFSSGGPRPPSNRTDWFAVNIDPTESDLTALRSEDLRTDLLPGVDFTYATEWEEASTGVGENVRTISTGTGFSRALLLIAVALLLVEQLMAWNFLGGLSLLVVFAACTLAWNLFRINSLAGVLVLAVLMLCVGVFVTRLRPLIRSSS